MAGLPFFRDPSKSPRLVTNRVEHHLAFIKGMEEYARRQRAAAAVARSQPSSADASPTSTASSTPDTSPRM